MTIEIAGWGFAVPAGSVSQTEAADHAVEMWGAVAGLNSTIPALYRRTGVKTRHSVVIDPHRSGEALQSFYREATSPNDRGPTTRDRMQFYDEAATGLAVQASRQALDEAGLAAQDITHLVTVSCSGFAAPGVDLGMIDSLSMSPGVARTNVGFMGCHGAFNGLRIARALAAEDPRAKVLVCCVELCSLHQQYTTDPQQIVANALFADGAAAVVVQQGKHADRWRIAAQRSLVLPDTADMMSWRIQDHGFAMTLSPTVPDLIRQSLPAWLETWLNDVGLSSAAVPSFAVHPGGPRILGAVIESLNLPSTALEASREILANYGNMSSPTILFILNRLRQSAAPVPCVALAFGPGLTIEAALFTADSE